jgi:hypothetical protein
MPMLAVIYCYRARHGVRRVLWMVPEIDHMATRIIPTVLTACWGLGFVHFLYSRLCGG